MDADIQVELGGQRMCWWAESARARGWVLSHPDLPLEAPEGIECLIRFGEPVIRRALADGLVVMAGDLEVSVCS
jgi:hypothetical protein